MGWRIQWQDELMRDRWFRWVGVIVLIASLIACAPTSPPVAPPPVASPSPLPEKQLEYNLHQLPGAIVHTLKIPTDSQFIVTTAIADQPQTVEEFATTTQAIAILNGGFFDPENRKSTSVVFQNGRQVAKPEDNERLMTNPNLLPYLDKILNRSEFRRYQCGAIVQYDIALRQQLPPTTCQLQDAIGAGPQLLPLLTSMQEGFVVIEDGKVVRDPLGQDQANARSAIGLLEDGSILWVLVAQRPDDRAGSGLSLPDLADFMKKMGVKQGLNLDGGSSVSMFYQGETFYGKVDQQGAAIARPVKSVLVLQSTKKPEEKPPVKN